MPDEGIYTQRDPIGLGGGNPTVYGYVWNTLTDIDTLGLVWEAGIPRPTGWILPQNGTWSGVPGHSNFIPANPKALGLQTIDVIPFKNGMPDFSKWSQGNYTVPKMTGNHDFDMPEIRRTIKKVDKHKSANAVKRMLIKKGLTPHHSGGKLVQLIPKKLHGGVRHMGGASELRGGGGCG